MTLAVQVNSLVKKYGSNTAVDNISFNIYKGEVFGLLGPNGAGKTTTLEIIEGLRMPTLGEVYVEGLSPIRDTKELRKSWEFNCRYPRCLKSCVLTRQWNLFAPSKA